MENEMIMLIIYGAFIGLFVALLNFGAGKLGSLGDVTFNYVKGTLCAVVGAAFGGYTAYMGGSVSPDVIMLLFSTVTLGGFGTVWLIDTITQIIVSYLQPKATLAQGMAISRPRV